MGFLQNEICYNTALEATDAYWSRQDALLTMDGQDNHDLHVYTFEGGAWLFREYFIAKNSGILTPEVSTVLPSIGHASCTFQPELTATDKFLDGSTLGWGVVAAMVMAWAIMQLYKARS